MDHTALLQYLGLQFSKDSQRCFVTEQLLSVETGVQLVIWPFFTVEVQENLLVPCILFVVLYVSDLIQDSIMKKNHAFRPVYIPHYGNYILLIKDPEKVSFPYVARYSWRNLLSTIGTKQRIGRNDSLRPNKGNSAVPTCRVPYASTQLKLY